MLIWTPHFSKELEKNYEHMLQQNVISEEFDTIVEMGDIATAIDCLGSTYAARCDVR